MRISKFWIRASPLILTKDPRSRLHSRLQQVSKGHFITIKIFIGSNEERGQIQEHTGQLPLSFPFSSGVIVFDGLCYLFREILNSVNVSNLLSFGLFSDREKIVVAISLFLLIYLSLRWVRTVRSLLTHLRKCITRCRRVSKDEMMFYSKFMCSLNVINIIEFTNSKVINDAPLFTN